MALFKTDEPSTRFPASLPVSHRLFNMLLYQLLFGAGLFGTAFAELNVTALLQLPACSVKCSTEIVNPSGCGLDNLQTCLCTNSTLQSALGECVIATCNVTEQTLAATITQKYICNNVQIESRSAEVVRNSIILAGVTYPIIILRFITRVKITGGLWWDDWVILAAAMFMIPNTFSPIYSAYYGFGNHFWNVDSANYPLLLKLFYGSSICYVIIQNLPKISILFLYLRVFPTPSFVNIIKLALLFVVLQATIFTTMVIFSCTPVDAIWDLSKKGKCLNGRLLTLTGAGFSIGQDLVIMFLPILELRILQMELRKKIELGFMFAIGSFGCITAMVRLKYIVKYYLKSIDSTWDNVDVVLWSDIETYVAVICACIMCFRPLVRQLCPTFLTFTSSSNSGSDAMKMGLRNSYNRFKDSESNNSKSRDSESKG